MSEDKNRILYETRRHASGACLPNYPPRQASEAYAGRLFPLVSGVSRIKRIWKDYEEPRKLRRLISLFISPSGENVAVAAANRIIILQKSDDFREPCGIFTCSNFCTFKAGAWSEYGDIIGVVDDSNTVYFIKSSGNEMGRIAMKDLKIAQPITGLIAPDDSNAQSSSLCGFTIVTSDGSLQHVEMCHDSGSVASSTQISYLHLNPKKVSHYNTICVDYHPKLCWLAVVDNSGNGSSASKGGSGFQFLSLWHKRSSSDLKLLFSIQFDGVFLMPRGYQGQQSYPKVSISQQGAFAAALDVAGDLFIFSLDQDSLAIRPVFCRPKIREFLHHVVDFTWWSNHIITVSKANGFVIMVDLFHGEVVMENTLGAGVPAMEEAGEGKTVFIETTSFNQAHDSLMNNDKQSHEAEDLIGYEFDQLKICSLRWTLMSFSERSVHEMYGTLISNKEYEAALSFSIRHGLDKDVVLKSQWVHSDNRMMDIKDFLMVIQDKEFVLSECLEKVGPTEDDAKALLGYGLSLTDQYVFSDSVDENDSLWDFRMARLKLLQYRDRLETFMGINMGRFSMQEYVRFRETPLYVTAVRLAESGKIGALNLLFKRYLYSLIPFILEILAGIPETVPVQTYGQLLPGANPPPDIILREEDWVECEKMVNFINKLPNDNQMAQRIRTEPIVRKYSEYCWPSTDELVTWYKKRALDIDDFSGQLDNCLCLIDMGRSRGMSALQPFYEDILYLMQVIYADDTNGDMDLSLNLSEWERLADYEKFQIMLKGSESEKLVKILRDRAIPFMRNRLCITSSNEKEYGGHAAGEQKFESYLVRWMKEMASENKLDLCLIVIEEGCKELESSNTFLEEMEAVDCALQCVYLCTSLDKWSIMATLLSKLPFIQGNDTLLGRLKLAEAHIEAGRILSFYQVPKPISFFLEAHADEKSVKQIFRLILSKFIRRQLNLSDNDWASLWWDMQFLQEKVFNFLEPEYMLIEFCRGLLKGGKFSLARNYLKGTSVVTLASDKAENLIIQAAREYFFSASSLASSEEFASVLFRAIDILVQGCVRIELVAVSMIWKARECLNLFPGSRSVKAEADIIDAITIKLPSLGVTLLPMQFRQIKDPMEIIRMAITNQPGAYVHVDDLIEVSKSLGLSSKDDISAVEEAIAREAALSGDLQVAFDLCLVLIKKGHGPIWDLCAAIAKGQGVENMEFSSRKLLLGFALSHCDEESISDLLHAWKDLDMQSHFENLMMLTGSTPNLSVPKLFIKSSEVQHEIIDFQDDIEPVNAAGGGNEPFSVASIKNMLSIVAKDLLLESGSKWDVILQNQKILSFAGSYLPWLLKLSRMESSATFDSGLIFGGKYVNSKVFAVMSILSWLVKNGFTPRDDLIISLTKSVLELPGSEEVDILGCSFLLNLVDAFHGVEVIEEQLRKRVSYQEVCSIMNVGMKYGLLNNSGVECKNSAQRRELLHRFFGEKHMPFSSDAMDKFGEVQSSFWREWKIKLEQQKHAADQSRAVESIIPGVEAARFLSGDIEYIQHAIYSLIESLQTEKKHVLTNVLKLAHSFGVSHAEVLLRFLNSALTSDMWTDEDIMKEIAEVREEIVGFAGHTIEFISRVVYPAMNGCRKDQLACLYRLLSDCYAQQQRIEEPLPGRPNSQAVHSSIGLADFYKLLEQECKRVAFIENLNFKNITLLDGLNLKSFADEVYQNINENSIEALANMVRSLVNVFGKMPPEGLILWQDVYKHYIMELLTLLEGKARVNVESPLIFQELISQIEYTYVRCRKYIELLSRSDIFYVIQRFFLLGIPNRGPYWDLRDDSAWQECLIFLISFYIRVTEEMLHIASQEGTQVIFQFDVNCLTSCLKLLVRLVMEDTISPSQGWGIVITGLNSVFLGKSASVLFIFCRGMLLLGCSFVVVLELFSIAAASHGSDMMIDPKDEDLVAVYLKILESILQNLPNDVSERQNLCHLFASLSKLEGDLECLKRIRDSVWDKMAAFSDDMMLPSHVRVYALELMQAAMGNPVKGSSVELLPIPPWEEWDPSHDTGKNRVTRPILGSLDSCGTSGGFTITLVALRSTQILAAISPDLEVAPNDLLDADTAAACFVKLCGVSDMESHFSDLVSVLAEWEGLFMTKKAERLEEASDSTNDWGNDEWDEGWESFQEAEPTENENKGDSTSLHPLHTCWTELFKILLSRSQFKDVVRLLDQYSSKPSGLLLDESSGRSLSDGLVSADIFWALKMVMLLPYKDLQLGHLDAAEDKLKGEGITDEMSKDFDILLLLLHSGLISTIMIQTSFDATFSYVSFLVGYFARRCQEICLSQSTTLTEAASREDRSLLMLFERIVLPSYICHLVKANQHMLAAFIITKFMHTSPSLSLINVAESSLRTYLRGQLQVHSRGEFDVASTSSEQILKNALSSLWEKLGDLIQSALPLISADVR